MNTSTKKKAIIVLGMHRSGTSALTRAIVALGASVGMSGRLVTPSQYNEKGFWELLDIVKFNDGIFEYLYRSWDSIQPMPEYWWMTRNMMRRRRKLARFIMKESTGCNVWVCKDPRISLLLPLWIDLLNELEMESYFVIALRNPLDVAASLFVRNEMELQNAVILWFLYNISAFYWTQGLKRLVVSYDRLIDNWEDPLLNIAHGCGIMWPDPDASLRHVLNGFFEEGLRHHHSTPEAFPERDYLPDIIRCAYESFKEAEKSPEYLNSQVFKESVANWFAEYPKGFKLFYDAALFKSRNQKSPATRLLNLIGPRKLFVIFANLLDSIENGLGMRKRGTQSGRR